MKKIITSIAALLLCAGISFAAETKDSNRSALASNTKAPETSTSFVSARSLAQIIEENTELRMKVEELSNHAEELTSLLDYSKMMHVTISNLQEQQMQDKVSDNKSQLDYARMMNATIVNLGSILNGNK